MQKAKTQAAHGSLLRVRQGCACEKCRTAKQRLTDYRNGAGPDAYVTTAARKTKARTSVRRKHSVLTITRHCANFGIDPASCVLCGEGDIHRDHVFPLVKGGVDMVFNLRPLCATHNQEKATWHPEVYFDVLAKFHRDINIRRSAAAALADYQTHIKPALIQRGVDVEISLHELRKAKKSLLPAIQ